MLVNYPGGPGRAVLFVALAIGSLLWWPNRREKGELKSREGFLIVVLFWTVLGSVGALPFIFAEQPNLTITDAFFESFSGLTTTGATTLVGLDSLPHAILFYRQMLQWFGGMGIIVLAVAILPQLYTTHLQDPALRVAQLQQPALTRTVALMRGPQSLPPMIEACFALLQKQLRGRGGVSFSGEARANDASPLLAFTSFTIHPYV